MEKEGKNEKMWPRKTDQMEQKEAEERRGEEVTRDRRVYERQAQQDKADDSETE